LPWIKSSTPYSVFCLSTLFFATPAIAVFSVDNKYSRP
jgi:hypothetical protein